MNLYFGVFVCEWDEKCSLKARNPPVIKDGEWRLGVEYVLFREKSTNYMEGSVKSSKFLYQRDVSGTLSYNTMYTHGFDSHAFICGCWM